MVNAFVQNMHLLWEHTIMGMGLIMLVVFSIVGAVGNVHLFKVVWPEAKLAAKGIAFFAVLTLFLGVGSYTLGGQLRGQLALGTEIKGIRSEILAMKMDEGARSYYLAKMDERDAIFESPISTERAKAFLAEAKTRFPQAQIAQK